MRISWLVKSLLVSEDDEFCLSEVPVKLRGFGKIVALACQKWSTR